jgi:hypothetical protein
MNNEIYSRQRQFSFGREGYKNSGKKGVNNEDDEKTTTQFSNLEKEEKKMEIDKEKDKEKMKEKRGRNLNDKKQNPNENQKNIRLPTFGGSLEKNNSK